MTGNHNHARNADVSMLGLERGRVTEPVRVAHDRDQHRPADLGEPGQGAGKLGRVDPEVGILTHCGVLVAFGLQVRCI
jgi:hypothetical protein